jgi:hypothetical protein
MLVVANKADILRYADVPEMSTETGQGVSEVRDMLVTLLEDALLVDPLPVDRMPGDKDAAIQIDQKDLT